MTMRHPQHEYLRWRWSRAAERFERALFQFHRLALKYSPDQPRVPGGQSGAGQWTRGGGISVSSPSEVLANLNLWAIGGDFSMPLVFDVAAVDIPSLADAVMGWLGPGAFQQNSPRGAIQFFSGDKTRLIRFDITPSTSHGLDPHINIDGRHIYLKQRS
jgi:hypothetical protein